MTVYQLRLAHVTKNENIKEEAKTKKPMHTLHSKFGPSPDSVNLWRQHKGNLILMIMKIGIYGTDEQLQWIMSVINIFKNQYRIPKKNEYQQWIPKIHFGRFLYSASQKIPPRGPDIFHFFHKRLRIFNRFLHNYYRFLSTLDYKFLFNYPRFWQSYAILSATTQFT